MTGNNIIVTTVAENNIIVTATINGQTIDVQVPSVVSVEITPNPLPYIQQNSVTTNGSLTGDGSTGNPLSASSGATTVTAGATTTLTVSSATVQEFTGTTTQIVVLPVVTTLRLGHQFTIANHSTGSITLNSSGGNLVGTITAGNTLVVRCILLTGTTAASWDSDYLVQPTEYVGNGTGNFVRTTSPALVTPSLGVATATSINGNTITTGTGTLSLSTFTATVPESMTVAGRNVANTFTQSQTITTSQNNITSSSFEISNTSTGTGAAAQIFVKNDSLYTIQNAVLGSNYSGTFFGLAGANLAAMTASTIGSVVYGNGGVGSVHIGVNNAIVGTFTSAGDLGIGTQTPDYAGFGKTVTVFSATASDFEVASSRTSGVIGAFVFASTPNTTLKEVGGIYGFVDGATAGNRGAYISFYTKADAGTEVERLRIGSTGLITVGSAGGGTGRFNVIGSTDIVQNRILAHSTQTSNIATWETSASVVLVKISGTGVFFPVQATTASAPAYVLGGMYYDTTLSKLRIGGVSGWETVTSS
jgi:hypothetical protein